MKKNTCVLCIQTQTVCSVSPRQSFHYEKQESGYIINILSTASLMQPEQAMPPIPLPNAAKAMTDTLIEEYRGTGIRISSISPGPVATTIWSHKTTPPDSSRLARMLRPQDIADIAAYLLSTPANVHIQDLLVTPWNY